MPYAEGRVYYDADSHVMETSDWLVTYADPDLRERIRPLYLGGAGKLADAAVRDADARKAGEVTVEAIEDGLMVRKGWSAYGAFDAEERSHALDLLGFDKQLVFSTFAPTQFLDGDPDLLYGGTRAHNRAMAEFCAHDDRLIAVGFVPLDDPARAAEAVDEALAFGCGAILVPSNPPKTHSPTHPDLDPVWARLQDAKVPLTLHVGGGGRPLRRSFHENGRPKPTDFLGGGENIRSKDYMVLHNPPEVFVACMVLDGVFEKFPGLMLRAGVSARTDVGLYLTKSPGANYGFVGGQVQHSLVGDTTKAWAAAARVSFVSMYGPADLNFRVYGVDLLASRRFALSRWATVSPYVGASTYLSSSHEKTAAVSLADEHVAGAQAMLGTAVQLSVVRLGVEYNVATVQSLTLKVGIGR